MARNLTTKIQLSGYRLGVRRVEQAMTRRDVTMYTTPFSIQTIAFAVGLFIALGVPVAGKVYGFFSNRGADQGNAQAIITKSGGRYVMYEHTLHPVTNLASARLIIGKPDVPKVVKDNTLDNKPRGLLMGIPSAPDNLTQRTDNVAQWTVCDKHTDVAELSLTKTDVLSTTLLAGTDTLTDAANPLRANDAVLVNLASAPDQQWMIYKGQRTLVGPNDMAARAALNLSPGVAANAIPISQGLFNAIPAAPALTAPYIAARGEVNPLLPQLRNGDVIITAAADGTRQYQVALPDGVQQITELIAELLINTGSTEITTLDRDQLAAVPLVSDINTDNYPDRAPTFRQPHVLCWTWKKGAEDLRATSTVLTGEALPIRDEDLGKTVPLKTASGAETTADASLTRPGAGWLTQVTGATPESHAQEQWMYIDDTGVRYFIGPDTTAATGTKDVRDAVAKTAQILGLSARPPLPIPWAVAKLYAPGSTLSRPSALTTHVQLPVDVNQHAAGGPG